VGGWRFFPSFFPPRLEPKIPRTNSDERKLIPEQQEFHVEFVFQPYTFSEAEGFSAGGRKAAHVGKKEDEGNNMDPVSV
jgi:hypothetical protein